MYFNSFFVSAVSKGISLFLSAFWHYFFLSFLNSSITCLYNQYCKLHWLSRNYDWNFCSGTISSDSWWACCTWELLLFLVNFCHICGHIVYTQFRVRIIQPVEITQLLGIRQKLEPEKMNAWFQNKCSSLFLPFPSSIHIKS